MPVDTLKNIFQEIEKGINTPKHPFKFGCLSSMEGNTPQQRMVVIRKLDHNQLTIYTDSRSPKVAQFIKNPEASILFYDTVQMTQIVLNGFIVIEEDENSAVWNSIPKHAHKDYTTLLAPGSPVSSSESDYVANKPNFCILNFTFHRVDYLRICKPRNLRIGFELNNTSDWQKNYLTP